MTPIARQMTGWLAPSLALLLAGTGSADTLRIVGLAPGDSVIVSIKGRTSAGCRVEVLESGGETPLPNFMPSTTCKSELAVYSTKHAMFHAAVETWTNSPADIHTIELRPPLKVPVRVWVAAAADRGRAVLDIKRARALYEKNRVGVAFFPEYGDLPADLAASIVNERCDAVPALHASAAYVPGVLNVYYVDGAFSGRNCAINQTPPACSGAAAYPARDGNVTYIGNEATVTTLAHEFGHAFGLRPSACGGHTNGLRGFAANNIMWAAGGEEREHFTLGQVFRMNTHRDQWGGTMLIRNGLREGPGRRCPPNLVSALCPPLRADAPRR